MTAPKTGIWRIRSPGIPLDNAHTGTSYVVQHAISQSKGPQCVINCSEEKREQLASYSRLWPLPGEWHNRKRTQRPSIIIHFTLYFTGKHKITVNWCVPPACTCDDTILLGRCYVTTSPLTLRVHTLRQTFRWLNYFSATAAQRRSRPDNQAGQFVGRIAAVMKHNLPLMARALT